MSDFDLEPLIREEKEALSLAVLGAGRDDRAPSGARDRALAALGLGVTSAVALPANAPKPSLFTRARAVTSAKITVGLAGLALIGAGAAFGGLFIDGAPPPAAPRSEMPQREPVRSEAPPPAIEGAVPIVTPDMLPSSEAPPPVVARMVPTPAASQSGRAPEIPNPTSRLARETALVDTATRDLSRELPAEALVSLDAYEREFPGGVFALEVTVLRIEALARAGRVAEADRLAAPFLAEHPTGPHARRVRAAQSHP